MDKIESRFVSYILYRFWGYIQLNMLGHMAQNINKHILYKHHVGKLQNSLHIISEALKWDLLPNLAENIT